MPLYEYACDVCGHRFEVIQKFSDKPFAECPKCGGAVRKLQSAPAFQLKGTGWYVTDYAKAGHAADKDAASAGNGASGEKEAAKGEKADKAEKSEKPGASEKTDKPGKTGESSSSAKPTQTPSKDS